jgi:glycosyltransferase involved in cell wall biosynthesis
MKIVQVLHTFPPYSRAGSENYAEALSNELLRRHDVTVVHRVAEPDRPEYELSEAQQGSLPVVRINRTFRDLTDFMGTYRSDEVARQFGAFLDRYEPDVVHFHHLTCLSTTCVSEAKQREIPVVCTLHDFWLLCPRSQLVRRDQSLCETHTDIDCVNCMAGQLRVQGGYARVKELWKRSERMLNIRLPRSWMRRVANRPFEQEEGAVAEIRERLRHVREIAAEVDLFISPSEFLRREFVEFGLPAEQVLVSGNGFDLSHWRAAPLRKQEPAHSGALRVAYLGTWIPTKGVDILIRAFQEIAPETARLDVHGYAVPYEGTDDYEGTLRELAGSRSNIDLRGAYAPSDIPGLLADADVLVIPSRWYENSPLTIHEAFLAGVPVVAAGHGGMAEFVGHEENGLHFRPGDCDSLRSAIERLATDRNLLERLGSNIPGVKSIEDNALELESIYGGLLK